MLGEPGHHAVLLHVGAPRHVDDHVARVLPVPRRGHILVPGACMGTVLLVGSHRASPSASHMGGASKTFLPTGILARLNAQQSCGVSQQASGPKLGADCFPVRRHQCRCCENSLGEGAAGDSPSLSLGRQPAPTPLLPQLGCHCTTKGGAGCPHNVKGTYRTTSTAPARTLGSLPMMETLAVKEPSMLNTTDSVPRATTVRYASA